MTNKEVLDKLVAICEEAGVKYILQVDDGETINGVYDVRTDSNLHNMARAMNKLSDHYEEHTKK